MISDLALLDILKTCLPHYCLHCVHKCTLCGKVSSVVGLSFLVCVIFFLIRQLLADNALETLKLDLAEQCFVHSKDLNGIQFVKKLRRLDVSASKY